MKRSPASSSAVMAFLAASSAVQAQAPSVAPLWADTHGSTLNESVVGATFDWHPSMPGTSDSKLFTAGGYATGGGNVLNLIRYDLNGQREITAEWPVVIQPAPGGIPTLTVKAVSAMRTDVWGGLCVGLDDLVNGLHENVLLSYDLNLNLKWSYRYAGNTNPDVTHDRIVGVAAAHWEQVPVQFNRMAYVGQTVAQNGTPLNAYIQVFNDVTGRPLQRFPTVLPQPSGRVVVPAGIVVGGVAAPAAFVAFTEYQPSGSRVGVIGYYLETGSLAYGPVYIDDQLGNLEAVQIINGIGSILWIGARRHSPPPLGDDYCVIYLNPTLPDPPFKFIHDSGNGDDVLTAIAIGSRTGTVDGTIAQFVYATGTSLDTQTGNTGILTCQWLDPGGNTGGPWVSRVWTPDPQSGATLAVPVGIAAERGSEWLTLNPPGHVDAVVAGKVWHPVQGWHWAAIKYNSQVPQAGPKEPTWSYEEPASATGVDSPAGILMWLENDFAPPTENRYQNAFIFGNRGAPNANQNWYTTRYREVWLP